MAAESAAAYSPALLPYVISGRLSERRLALTDEAFYAAHGVTVCPVAGPWRCARQSTGSSSTTAGEVAYGRLLVATGASAKGSAVAGADDGEP